MNNILTGRTSKTIREQIITTLNDNGEMRFSEIRAALGDKNDNTINRELKTLMAVEPPFVLKNKSGGYLLNREHPLFENTLGLIGLIPKDTDVIFGIGCKSDINEKVGYSMSIVSSHVEGFQEDLLEELEKPILDEVGEVLDKLYFGLLLVKLNRIIKNKIDSGEIKEAEAEEYWERMKEEVFVEGIELHILPIKKNLNL